MDTTTLTTRFQQQYADALADLENSYHARLLQATDREYAYRVLLAETADNLLQYEADPLYGLLFRDFIHLQKMGHPVMEAIPLLRYYYSPTPAITLPAGIDFIPPATDNKTAADNAARLQLLEKESSLLPILVAMQLCANAPAVLKAVYQGLQPEQPAPVPAVQWAGKPGQSNDFVQLIYALIKSGYLQLLPGTTIEATIENIARLWQVPLSKYWASNHSNSIHQSNHDYTPRIFNDMMEQYRKYADNLIMEKRNRRLPDQ
jgi:hypothetical protein